MMSTPKLPHSTSADRSTKVMGLMPGCILEIKADDYNPSPTEQKKYKDLGYLSLAGSLLWLSRRCYPNLLFATSQLCSVMSMPSEHAWNQAIRVLTWLRDNY